jgi:hypothetical protein
MHIAIPNLVDNSALPTRTGAEVGSGLARLTSRDWRRVR